ncbi:MAG TPA: hypothetical protein VGR59_16255 [Gemmatimonadaceae bacterium]|nr:hypothetical protein [Gemmatimonadaceae bacterium]
MLSPLEKPRLVLRVGVAGTIKLPESERARLHQLFAQVYRVLATRLEALTPARDTSARPDICSYYAAGDEEKPARPLMRLVSGLADGTDQIAFESLLAFECEARTGPSRPGARTDFELVAILPCDAISFRDNSAVKDKAAFDTLLGRCAYAVELDGHCAPHPPHHAAPDRLTIERRNRAFRVQAAALLRHCDLLIADADPEAGAGIGGTRETMAAAVALGIPVIFLSAAAGERQQPVSVITRLVDLERTGESAAAPWERSVEQIVTRILADPRTSRAGPYAREAPEGGAAQLGVAEAELLDEFFDGGERRARVRPRLWSGFVRRFHRLTATGADTAVEPFASFRARAAQLSAHYTGLYRGAFLVNYALAALAVALAVATLMYLLLLERHRAAEGDGARVLVSIALAELAVLVAIFFNTHHGNSHHWNSKAVDFRYLAERLRAMYYLSPMGSLRLAPPRVARYAATALRQSVVDWLLQAVIRQAPPGTGMPGAAAPARSGTRVVQSDVDRALAAVHDNWLATQIEYHRATSHTQLHMHRWIQRWVWRLNLAVIIIVFLDLLLILARLLGFRSVWVEAGHSYGPVLVFFAAVLPAVVASLNSIRFQSECLRIAERSAVMVEMLEGCRAECEVLRARMRTARTDDGTGDRGGWTLEALDLGEVCAQMLSDEVAEWSVLYSRDLLEA